MSNHWRLRGLTLLATLLMPACRRMHKEPFEKEPLAPGEIKVARLSERANLTVERVRFWSNEMNEPRFFLALIPKTHAPPSEVFILNHGWWDRPEDLLQYLKVDQVYDEMLGRGEVRPAIVIVPDVRFSNFYREYSDRFPYPNYLTLVADEVAGTVSHRYGIPFERERWAIGGFSFGGYLSLDVGRRFPGRFSSVSIVSGLSRQRVELLAIATAASRAARFPWPGKVYRRRARPHSPAFSSLWIGRSSLPRHARLTRKTDGTRHPAPVVDRAGRAHLEILVFGPSTNVKVSSCGRTDCRTYC